MTFTSPDCPYTLDIKNDRTHFLVPSTNGKYECVGTYYEDNHRIVFKLWGLDSAEFTYRERDSLGEAIAFMCEDYPRKKFFIE